MDGVGPANQIANHHSQASLPTARDPAPEIAPPAPTVATPPSLLIRTQLHPPVTRTVLVARPRLHERIAQGLRGPLTLLTAPAGFGKTTLVASSVAGCGMPLAWLSLDPSDNQPGRFLSYLLAALHEADKTHSIARSETAALAAAQAPPEAILTSLVNDLDTLGSVTGGEIALVLDDYQFITSAAVHKQLAFLVEHCPSTLHLVIATRSDPPLPLARLRARGQVVELRAADLSFTEAEAAQFLNAVMGLRLDRSAVAALQERTEGWIAGLQMAALSMRDREDIPGFIAGFSGTNRYILDYLLEEVLANQPPQVQDFLLYTSILERLTASLCNAVVSRAVAETAAVSTGGNEGHEPAPQRARGGDRFSGSEALPLLSHESSAGAILRYLERANLFLVPLDEERAWYRYHHLFANLLRTRLQESLGEAGIARLHLRASEWYEQHGEPLDAIAHAALAADFRRVERLIAENYLQMLNHGETSRVGGWLGKLRREVVYGRPWLCLYEAFSRSWFGQLDEARSLLDRAERLIAAEASDNPAADGRAADGEAMRGYHAYVQSRVTAMQGDNQRAIALCLTARQQIPTDNLSLHIEMAITLGYEYFLHGDFRRARAMLHDMMQSCQAVGAINNPVAAYALLARMEAVEGRLHHAYALYERAAQLIQQTSGPHRGVTGLVEMGRAALLCEWNDLDTALGQIKRGLELLPLWGKADDLCLAYTTLARIQAARGEWAAAAEASTRAGQLAQSNALFSEARGEVEAAQGKAWLARGDQQAAARWAATLPERFGAPDPFRFEDDPAHLTWARLLLTQDRGDAAVGVLSGLEQAARAGGRQGRLIEILLLKALALQAVGDATPADRVLTESLTLAEPNGYVRVFLDERQPMQRLLAQWLVQARARPLRDYARQVLAQFTAAPPVVRVAPDEAVAVGKLVEPLSQREREVLELLALGQTNQTIAQQLIISPGTVKAHTASIYQKLDVANRTAAVGRARQLGILP